MQGGATLCETSDGGADKCICVIKIISDEVRRELIDLVAAELDLNVDSIRLAASSWREQLVMAVAFEGGSFFSAAGIGYVLSVPRKLISPEPEAPHATPSTHPHRCRGSSSAPSSRRRASPRAGFASW